MAALAHMCPNTMGVTTTMSNNTCNAKTTQSKDERTIPATKKFVTTITTNMRASNTIILMIERIPGREINQQLITWYGFGRMDVING